MRPVAQGSYWWTSTTSSKVTTSTIFLSCEQSSTASAPFQSDTTCNYLLKGQATWLANSAEARADHEIVSPFNDRLDQTINQFWTIAPIAIEKHDDPAV